MTDLFATEDTAVSIDDEEPEDAPVDSEPSAPGTTSVTSDPEDTTADESFAQLRDEHADAGRAHAADEVGDGSPENIVARVDEETAHVDQIDDSIRAEQGALDDLPLAARREADGFL